MAAEDIEKTAIIIPFRLFEYFVYAVWFDHRSSFVLAPHGQVVSSLAFCFQFPEMTTSLPAAPWINICLICNSFFRFSMTVVFAFLSLFRPHDR
jgi:hypothetical protein